MFDIPAIKVKFFAIIVHLCTFRRLGATSNGCGCNTKNENCSIADMDMTEAMIEKARENIRTEGLANVELQYVRGMFHDPG